MPRTSTATFRCKFCHLPDARILRRNRHAVAIRDRYPVSDGHTLVVPERHVPRFYDLTQEEQAAVWELVTEVRAALVEELHPDGFNIGVNDGVAAGQTVMHGHVHVIPRFMGDVPECRGGIRWVLPERAAYWEGATDDDI